MMKNKIVLATHNSGKISEFQSICGQDFPFVLQSDLGIPSPEETANTFVENALIKARHAAHHAKMPAMADDSGLCVPALKGAPGIYSARYAGEHANAKANIEKLLFELRNIPKENRGAFFYCVIVFVLHENDPTPLIAEGLLHGEILQTPRGEYGFGYDPIVFLPAHDCAVAELKPEIKNQLSHRANALKQVREKLCRYPHYVSNN